MIAALQCGLLMAPIASESVYTKTAKGILEVKNKAVKVPRELTLVLLAIDGKSSIGELQPRSGMTAPQFHHAIGNLVADGYIKVVSPARETTAAHDDEVDFIPQQALTALNMEAASHALAAAEAAKRAQAESRAALDARMLVESEARARALAEARADAESQAQVAAEEAARNAMNERVEAELQAQDAADAQARAQAEARARAAAAAAVRAEAEARVRAEALARAKAEAEDKRVAQEVALREVEARARSEEQAQARAEAEDRARVALEAHMQALQSVRTTTEEDAEAARARVRELEQQAAEARAAARESAEAEGRADEVAEPEMDIADRVRQLNARVSAERRAREEAARKPRVLDERANSAGNESERAWPSLQLADTTAPAAVDLLDISIETPQEPERVSEAAPQATEDGEFPVVDLERAEPPPRTPEHEPTALERAMAQIARAKAENESNAAPAIEAAPDARATEPPADASTEAAAAGIADAAPAEKLVPTLDDDEPLQERLNVDRAAHDIMAEEAEARRKAETAQFTRDAIDARRRRADEEARKAKLAHNREQRRKALTAGGIALVVLPLAGVLWLQFSTLDGYIPEAARALEKRFNQPVSIGGLRYPLLPRPRLILENVNIGEGSLTAKRVEAPVFPLAVLAGVSSFATIEVDGAEIDQRALVAIPAWTGGRTAGSIQTEQLRVRGLQVKLANAALDPVDGEVEFAPNGTVRRASFVGEKMKLLLTPQADGARVELTATGWRIPYGPPLEWSHFQLRGLIDHTQVAAAEFTGRVGGGGVEGALNARWADTIEIRGDFSAAGVRLQELARALNSEFSATGMLKAPGRFVMQAPDWPGLAAGSRLEAAFTGSRGEITNIDLMRAVQSPTPGAMRGGRTPFESFSGTLQVAGGRYLLPQLNLQAGPLIASGTVTVSPGGALDGRITAALTARGTRSTLLLGGTLRDPQLRR